MIFLSIFILIYRQKFRGILHEILCYNRQIINAGDASVRLILGTKEWKVLLCLICLMEIKYFERLQNVLMTIILLFLHLHTPLKKPYCQETVPL